MGGSGKIYLLQSEDKLLVMKEQEYAREDILQTFIEKYPDLLPGDQIDPDNPRQWLLVSREMPVPDTAAAKGRWGVDHLFLDQDGIPTFVEVKRSTDTRIRRAVVGQMLEYAANAVTLWITGEVQNAFSRSCAKAGKDPDKELETLLEVSGTEQESPADYWERVGDNLKNGRVRLLFVADEIPRELQRIVEFLNGQMEHAEVLAIEVKQFVTDKGDIRSLVPRVIGQTESTRAQKAKGRRKLTSETFYRELAETTTPDIARELKEMARGLVELGLENTWGASSVSIRLPDPAESSIEFTVVVFTTGGKFYLGWLDLVETKGRYDGDLAQRYRKEVIRLTGAKETQKNMGTVEHDVKDLLARQDEFLQAVRDFKQELTDAARARET